MSHKCTRKLRWPRIAPVWFWNWVQCSCLFIWTSPTHPTTITIIPIASLTTAVQGLRFSCYSCAPEPRHPVHVTDVYATESRTPLVRELSADRFSVGLLLHCSPPSRVRAGEWAKVCGGQAPLWSAASAEKQRIFFLFRLQPTRHRYSLTHSTAHMNSCQSTKWHQTQ